ncbi:MAG: helix-turn-helix transcriptional regulator [Acidobacteria bacterium]|nr:helix-turn-helix transcriptional regulator [Acidobacteriota bacterium]
MGRAAREKPNRLAEKLKLIREKLGLSQDGMLIRLGLQDSSMNRASISGYELGEREPSLLVLYAYSNAANVFMEVLVDDKIDLPDMIPSEEKSLGKRNKKPVNL